MNFNQIIGFILVLINYTALTDASTLSPEVKSSRASDSLELVNLFQQTRGDLWKVKWDFNDPIDTWFGVQLNANNRVYCIDLDGNPDCRSTKNGGNHLHGSLPELELPFLEHLFMSSNQLSGQIPSLDGTPELLTLQLSGNRLEGSIPDFSTLQKLVKLDLEYNKLTGSIPDFDLENLETIYLGNNQLNGWLPVFAFCDKLKHLYVNKNNLSGELTAFSHLYDLQQLLLSNNKFEGDLPDFFLLESLIMLNASNNRLEGCCDEKQYAHLRSFNIDNNNLDACENKDSKVPNAFSPNNDGVNDLFTIVDLAKHEIDRSSMEFVVWNLNKRIVYSNKKFKGAWDGRSSTGIELPEGLYIYQIQSVPINQKGTVFLKR